MNTHKWWSGSIPKRSYGTALYGRCAQCLHLLDMAVIYPHGCVAASVLTRSVLLIDCSPHVPNPPRTSRGSLADRRHGRPVRMRGSGVDVPDATSGSASSTAAVWTSAGS